MQQPPAQMPPSMPENRYPDSLYLELVATTAPPQEMAAETIELYLSVTFNEQWESIGAGRIRFGFKGGELKINLENGVLPAQSRDLSGSVELSPSQTPSQSSIACQVFPAGTERAPTWLWQGKTSTSVLRGSLQQTKLGTVQVTGKPCRIDAVFTVSADRVYLTGAEGLWPHHISPNQLAILERKLVFFLLRSRLQPYLSRVVWYYDDRQGLLGLSPTDSDEQASEPSPSHSEELTALNNTIEQVIAAKTDNFFELAAMVGLNPLADFAGAKLLGASLQGADLSGANLRRAYLRGADLSDADLSGADLQGASLGGADLSGAYLSDANLSGADLHRASLVLANLSGARLSGTNLSEGNLSNANLSDTNLGDANLAGADLHRASFLLANLSGTAWSNARTEEARFGRNAGLSEQQKQELKRQGAQFED
jgi:uncharacterized protein YjbI with pentapeptide repeats